jgi:hypothetical protein
VTDPYLFSGNDDAPAPVPSVDKTVALARRLGLPYALFEDVSPDALDDMEETAAQMEEDEEA